MLGIETLGWGLKEHFPNGFEAAFAKVLCPVVVLPRDAIISGYI